MAWHTPTHEPLSEENMDEILERCYQKFRAFFEERKTQFGLAKIMTKAILDDDREVQSGALAYTLAALAQHGKESQIERSFILNLVAITKWKKSESLTDLTQQIVKLWNKVYPEDKVV